MFIITTNLCGNKTDYLSWQPPVWEDDGYFWTDKKTFRETIRNGANTKEHPILFDSRIEAIRFLKRLNILQKCRVIEWK